MRQCERNRLTRETQRERQSRREGGRETETGKEPEKYSGERQKKRGREYRDIE